MHGEPADEPTASKVQQAHEFVLVPALCHVLRPFRRRIRQIRSGAAIDVPADDRRVPQAQRPRRQRVVRAHDGQDDARDDRVVALLHEPERGQLREEVLEVPADPGVLVRARDRDVLRRVEPAIARLQLREDRAPDARVAHGDVRVDEHDARCRGVRGGLADDPRARALPLVQPRVRLRE
ncbi:unnamed protein product [Mycena citricolor]|uniref:Uncharacterized protein n=1 Tax=Mycena citricolor TaxID=2018698 RepID=A0AAD2HCK4_9AGAR|nr:unnamed protein product [Mycena citricolor]